MFLFCLFFVYVFVCADIASPGAYLGKIAPMANTEIAPLSKHMTLLPPPRRL